MAVVNTQMPPFNTAAEAMAGAGNTTNQTSTNIGGGNGNVTGVGNNNSTTTSQSTTSLTSSSNNNTISAAADSSDNQPSTPQPQIGSGGNNTNVGGMHNDQQQQQQQQQQQHTSTSSLRTTPPIITSHHPFAPHHMYTSVTGGGILSSMFNGGNIYPPHTVAQDMQQQQQQPVGYTSYLNSYEQFYHQQQTHVPGNNMEFGGGSGGNPSGLMFGHNNPTSDFRTSTAPSIRFHPYLATPISGLPSVSENGAENGAHDTAGGILPPNSSGAVSTTTVLSPRVVSSSSPTSTSTNLQMSTGGSGIGGGNPNSPGCKLQCKKCGIMCNNESELQEHVSNVHGASPFSSSGYSSSSCIKEEITGNTGNTVNNGNMGNNTCSANNTTISNHSQQSSGVAIAEQILDLDSHKMVGPPTLPAASMESVAHPSLHDNPLHSMHNMQHRAWDSVGQDGLPSYMQQSQQDTGGNYMDSICGGTGGGGAVGGSDMCQQSTASVQGQQTIMPVSSSPAEFPSTTTGGPQDQQQQYRGFEPPSSSSALPANSSITAKAATWKSNEARRPKTYNCTACNKWFTSSGHLKRHYNTTLHKNAVKSSGQPDPASLPISTHHHPARDPSAKHSRRGASAAQQHQQQQQQQQQQVPAPVQPPKPPRTPPEYTPQGAGLTQFSASLSPTQQHNHLANGMPGYGQQNASGFQTPQQPYMHQIQSTTNVSPQHASINQMTTGATSNSQTVLNGHPNGLAGPSAPQATPIPSSQIMRGLLNTTPTTITTKNEIMEEDNSPMAMEVQQILQHQLEDQATAGEPQQHQELHQHQQQQGHQLQEMEVELSAQEALHLYHQRPNSNITTQSHHIICHPQYQEHLQQQQQMVDTIFSHTLPQGQQVHMQQLPPPHSIMEALPRQCNSIIPLDINMQQQQLQPITTNMGTTTNMDNIHMHSLHPHHHPQQVAVQSHQGQMLFQPMHNMLHNNSNIQEDPSILNTTINITPIQQLQQPPLQHTTNTIPSFQQVPQASVHLEPTMTYHTIIGSPNSDTELPSNDNQSGYLQFTTLEPYGQTQMITTHDGQLLQLYSAPSQMMAQPIFSMPNRGAVPKTYAGVKSYRAQRSPQEADLPPDEIEAQELAETSMTVSSTMVDNIDDSNKSVENSNQGATNLQAIDANDSIRAQSTTSSFNNSEQGVINMPAIDSEDSIRTQSTTSSFNNSEQGAINVQTIDSEDSIQDQSTAVNGKGKGRGRGRGRGRGKAAGDENAKPKGTIKTAASISKRKGSSSTHANILKNDDGRVICPLCGKDYTTICYLTQHHTAVHSGKFKYHCTTCGKKFPTEDVFEGHVVKHTALEKPYKCVKCPKQFYHNTDLQRHINGQHENKKLHVCEYCQKRFCRKDHLRKHIETHTRPKPISKKAQKKLLSNSMNEKFNNLVMSLDLETQEEKLQKQQQQQQEMTQQLSMLNDSISQLQINYDDDDDKRLQIDESLQMQQHQQHVCELTLTTTQIVEETEERFNNAFTIEHNISSF